MVEPGGDGGQAQPVIYPPGEDLCDRRRPGQVGREPGLGAAFGALGRSRRPVVAAELGMT